MLWAWARPPGPLRFALFHDVGQQRELARSLDGTRELALFLGRHRGDAGLVSSCPAPRRSAAAVSRPCSQSWARSRPTAGRTCRVGRRGGGRSPPVGVGVHRSFVTLPAVGLVRCRRGRGVIALNVVQQRQVAYDARSVPMIRAELALAQPHCRFRERYGLLKRPWAYSCQDRLYGSKSSGDWACAGSGHSVKHNRPTSSQLVLVHVMMGGGAIASTVRYGRLSTHIHPSPLSCRGSF